MILDLLIQDYGKHDENKLYDDINKRLIGLETSLDMNKDELEATNKMEWSFRFAQTGCTT